MLHVSHLFEQDVLVYTYTLSRRTLAVSLLKVLKMHAPGIFLFIALFSLEIYA